MDFKGSLLVRPKGALNYRAALGRPGKSINPGKYNDPRCGGRRYKNPPLTSTSLVVGRAYGFARYTRNAALQFYINLLGPRRDRFVERVPGRSTIPWNLREYKFRTAITYVVGYDVARRAGGRRVGGWRGATKEDASPFDCLIKPPRPLRSFG